jgi:hypothetical protein
MKYQCNVFNDSVLVNIICMDSKYPSICIEAGNEKEVSSLENDGWWDVTITDNFVTPEKINYIMKDVLKIQNFELDIKTFD